MRENELKIIDQTLQRMTEQLEDVDEFIVEMRVLMAVRERLLNEMTDDMKKMEAKAAKTDDKLDNLVDKITRWEAKLGGIMFVGTAMWAFVVLMKEQIFGFFKGVVNG